MAIKHGPSIEIVTTGVRPTRESPNRIFLVGTSPQYLVASGDRSLNTPVLVTNRRQGALSFGEDRLGYTIPKALDGIFDQATSDGGVEVYVVNVLDAFGAQATTTVTAQSQTFSYDAIQIPRGAASLVVKGSGGTPTYVLDTDYIYDSENGIITRISGGGITANSTVKLDYSYPSGAHLTTVTAATNTFATNDTIQLEEGLSAVVVTGTGGTPTYVLNTDYSLNTATGVITRLTGGAIASGASVKVTYTYVDPSIVQNSDIIGGVDGDGDRLGLEAAKDCYALFGVKPRLLIAPGYSSVVSVTSAIDVVAFNIDAIGIVDAPIGISVNTAISGRGAQGTINFNSGSRKLVGVYPHAKIYRNLTDTNELDPASSRVAGIWINASAAQGISKSPSNIEMRGIVGLERPIEFIIGNFTTEANNLNDVGIMTLINGFGTGIRTWGNRSFAFPTNTSPENFMNIEYARIVIHEALQFLAFQYIDGKLNNALIESFLDSANAYLRTLIASGDLIDGSRLYYSPSDNLPTQLADGIVSFRLQMLPPPPAENINIISILDVALAANLNVGQEAVGV